MTAIPGSGHLPSGWPPVVGSDHMAGQVEAKRGAAGRSRSVDRSWYRPPPAVVGIAPGAGTREAFPCVLNWSWAAVMRPSSERLKGWNHAPAALHTRQRHRLRVPPRPAVLGIVLAAALVSLTGCGRGPSTSTAQVAQGVTTVQMHDRRFQPVATEVPAGATVTWQFTDGGRHHNVVGDGFSSQCRHTGPSPTFSRPGGYRYRCTLPKRMEGEVIVT
jgi:plastocyanin